MCALQVAQAKSQGVRLRERMRFFGRLDLSKAFDSLHPALPPTAKLV